MRLITQVLRTILIMDSKQLSPVKQGSESKVFYKTDFPGFTLNIIERQQDNPLVNTLIKLRGDSEVIFESDTHAEKGLRVHNLANFQMILSESFISLEEYNKIPQSNRILAYTNRRVAAFNSLARRLMACNKTPINKGELLLAYDSFSRSYEEVLANGCEYTVMSVKKEDNYLPHYGVFQGYTLKLKTVGNDEEIFSIFLLDPEESEYKYKNLTTVLESLRLKAIKRKYLWKNFFALNESFITMYDLIYKGRVIRKKSIDYGYATTVHKSLNWLL